MPARLHAATPGSRGADSAARAWPLAGPMPAARAASTPFASAPANPRAPDSSPSASRASLIAPSAGRCRPGRGKFCLGTGPQRLTRKANLPSVAPAMPGGRGVLAWDASPIASAADLFAPAVRRSGPAREPLRPDGEAGRLTTEPFRLGCSSHCTLPARLGGAAPGHGAPKAGLDHLPAASGTRPMLIAIGTNARAAICPASSRSTGSPCMTATARVTTSFSESSHRCRLSAIAWP